MQIKTKTISIHPTTTKHRGLITRFQTRAERDFLLLETIALYLFERRRRGECTKLHKPREKHFSSWMRGSTKCCAQFRASSLRFSYFRRLSPRQRSVERDIYVFIPPQKSVEAQRRDQIGGREATREAQRHSKVACLHGDAIACAQIIDSDHATDPRATIMTT